MTNDSIPQDNAPEKDFSKRYLLFQWKRYPWYGPEWHARENGAYNFGSDFRGSFDTVESAMQYKAPNEDLDAGAIVDQDSHMKIATFNPKEGWVEFE
jgi:hypothetical protein